MGWETVSANLLRGEVTAEPCPHLRRLPCRCKQAGCFAPVCLSRTQGKAGKPKPKASFFLDKLFLDLLGNRQSQRGSVQPTRLHGEVEQLHGVLSLFFGNGDLFHKLPSGYGGPLPSICCRANVDVICVPSNASLCASCPRCGGNTCWGGHPKIANN